MMQTSVWIRVFLSAGLIVLLGACDLSDEIDNNSPRSEVVARVEKASEEPPGEHTADELPEAVAKTRDEILAIIETGSIRSLARMADAQQGFRSNYGNLNHYDHWYIMKRAGLDPLEKTAEILKQPFGIKDFGAEKYYIWPALAVRAPEDLDFSRLSFSERATLSELVGEDGIERMKAGEAYPGFRLAIREDGRWVYLLHDN